MRLDFRERVSFPCNEPYKKGGEFMGTIITHAFGNLIRWAIYLVLVGEITSCTIDLKEKARTSVSTGLINLKNLNQSLHQKKFK